MVFTTTFKVTLSGVPVLMGTVVVGGLYGGDERGHRLLEMEKSFY